MGFKKGDKVRVATFEQVLKIFPGRGINHELFERIGGKTFIITEIIHGDIVLDDEYTIALLHTDVLKKLNSINLPSNLFEL